MSTPSALFAGVPIDKEYLVETYLFGLSLTDGQGNEFPDNMYLRAINYAISWVQRYIDVCILPTPFKEEHDYDVQNWRNFVYIPPDHIPILSVEKVSVEFPLGTTVIEFPPEWVRFDPLKQIRIVPTGGAGLATFMIGTGQIMLPMLYGGAHSVPFLLNVEYTAGFEFDKIPPDILHAIGQLASIQILHPAGDLIIGPGIANQEIRLNSLIQKIETTSSPTNAGYGARIINYKNEIKEMFPVLQRHYHGIRLGVA